MKWSGKENFYKDHTNSNFWPGQTCCVRNIIYLCQGFEGRVVIECQDIEEIF